MIYNKNNKKDKGRQGGYTLVEMMVVFGIMTMFMVYLVFNNIDFTNDVALKAEVQKVASIIRETQVSALAPIRIGVSPPVLGVYLTSDTGENDKVIKFTDVNDNMTYSVISTGGVITTDTTEANETISLKNNVVVDKISSNCISGAPDCTDGVHPKINIAFKHPETNAKINNNGSVAISTITFSKGGRKLNLVIGKGGDITITK